MEPPPLAEEIRRRLTARFGAPVAPWLDGLPPQAAALASAWDVTLDRDGRAVAGGTSVVLRGRAADGAGVVLKLTPEPALAVAEADALAVWQGGGAAGGELPPVPRLLARDDRAGALLLEAIEPGRPADADADGAPLAPGAVARLLRALRRPAPPAGVPPLRERADWCFELWHRRREESVTARVVIPDDALERGHRLVAELADDPAAPRAFVHGDLHLGNVLDGGPARGLVAIDPRPCVGDPGWDAVDLVLWGVAGVEEAQRRIAAVAAAAGDDPDRLRAWCAGLAAMAAAALAVRPGPLARDRIDLLLALAA